MGSQQSKPASQDVHTVEKLSDRVRSMQLQEQTDGYMHVCEKGEVLPPPYNVQRTETLSVEATTQWEKELLKDPKNRFAISAVTQNPLKNLIKTSAALSDHQTFNIKIPFEGDPITNQRSSGRCWLFAATNVFRVAIMKKHNLKEFELSQQYLFYWDKLEKANWMLEHIIDTAGEDLDGRLVQSLLSSPVGDGGQWDMVANLVAKYGLVPQAVYPDCYNAKSSSVLGSVLTTKLREFALTLRSLASSASPRAQASIPAAKDKMMQEIHSILTIMLGPPPAPSEAFTWEYYDADGKYNKVEKTPVEFAAELSSKNTVRACGGGDVNEMFSLVNDPRNEFNTLLSVERLGNVVGGRPITYVNVDMTTIKQTSIAMLKAGLPIFFGSDVSKFSESSSGIMDTALFDYTLAFPYLTSPLEKGLSKAQRLLTGESAMTHAMVLTGVQVDESGHPVRWRVMNSWGTDAGEKGYFVMTDEWMDQFVYQVVVPPAFVSKEVRAILESEAKMLPLWDPMGALA